MRLAVLIAVVEIGLLVYSSGARAQTRAAEPIPDDLSATDWSSIRAAYDANRLAAFAVDGGYKARNPGQQWRTQFDGRGFVATPDAGVWSWGLELVSYGVEGAERMMEGVAPANSRCGQRIEYEWDECLTEWYVNDQRGLEHGYTVHRRLRPEGARWLPEASACGWSAPLSSPARRADERLRLTLAVRGTLRPQINRDGRGVTFVDASGATVVNYTGLTVFDATGAEIPSWFESADSNSLFAIRHSQFITIVVDDRDATYPLTIDPVAQQAYLKASNTGGGDSFGISVAVSGDTVVVGANGEDSNATGVNGNQADNSAFSAGAAYVFVRNGGVWTQQAYLKASNTGGSDQFGFSVGVSGDTVVVGAYGEDSSATGVNGNDADNSATESGAVYVFVRSGSIWSQQAYLKASNAEAGDQFGLSVAASGETVVVGARDEDSNATGVNGNQADNSVFSTGAAYVFVRIAGIWSQQAYLKASNPGNNDGFGFPVAASDDTVVIGAVGESSNATGVNGNQADNSAGFSGAAYVFVRDGGGWSQQAYLKASNTGASDFFGSSVAASGDRVVVGAPSEDSSATGVNGNQVDNTAGDSGAAYVFARDANQDWGQQAYLKASNTGAIDDFGRSVAISGDTIVVGANWEDGSAIGVNGPQADNGTMNSGAAYVFAFSGGLWSQQAYLKASNTRANDRFGFSVAVSGDTTVVGAFIESSNATGVNGNQANNSAASSGAAYVFTDLGPDADADTVPDSNDACPNNATGLPVDCTGRPQRDCNNDCLVDGADVQCIADEMLNQ